MPALGGPEQRLFEAGPECGGWRYGVGRVGFRGRRTASTWSSAIGAPPIICPRPRFYLYSLKDGKKRQLTRPPANLSDIHPVVSPDGRYLAFVRLNHAARGGNVFLQKLEQLQVVGEPTQLTFDRAVNAFDWMQDSRSVIHDAGPVEPGLWRIAVAGGAPELVLPNIRAFRALGGTLRCWRGLSEHADRFEHLGTAHAGLPESSTLRGRDISRSSRRRPATRICNSHRMEHGSYSPLAGRATVRCGCRTATDPGRTQLTHFEGGGRRGKPYLECRRQADRVRRDTDGHGQLESLYRARRRRPRQTADVRRVQQRSAELVSRWPVDLLWIRIAPGTGKSGGCHRPAGLRSRSRVGAVRSRSSRRTAAASTTRRPPPDPGHLGGPCRGRPGSPDRRPPGPAAEFSTSQRTESS